MHRVGELERIQALGIALIYKKNLVKIIVGGVCAFVGLVTLPLPTGSIILISVGLSLMANGGLNIYDYKKALIQKIKLKCLRWFVW